MCNTCVICVIRDVALSSVIIPTTLVCVFLGPTIITYFFNLFSCLLYLFYYLTIIKCFLESHTTVYQYSSLIMLR